MKQYLTDEINHLIEKKKELQNDLKIYVQDKSLPLSDRWEIFCLAGNKGLLPHDGWIRYFTSIDLESYIQDYQRHETVSLQWMVEFLEDENKNDNRNHPIEEFKEEILDKFIWSFELDW